MANITYHSLGSLAVRHDGWNDLTDEAWSVWDEADWSSYEYTMGAECNISLPVSNLARIRLLGSTNLAIHYRITAHGVLVLLGSSIVSCSTGALSGLKSKVRTAHYDDRLTFVPKRGRRISGTPPPADHLGVFSGGKVLVSIGRSALLGARATRSSWLLRVRSASPRLVSVSREAT